MRFFLKKRSAKVGLPPGSLVHIGEVRKEDVVVRLLDYTENTFEEKELKTAEACYPYKDKESITWLDIEGLQKIDLLEKIGEHYGLHPLVLEDILNTDQRPKMEDYDDYVFIVMKMFHFNKQNEILTEQVSIILGKNYVISFQEGIEGDTFNGVRERIRNNKGKIRKMGADFLVYSLIDSIVDTYFTILEHYGDLIEDIEEKLIENPETRVLNSIHALKREMLLLRKSVWPTREVLTNMEREDTKLIHPVVRPYIRDVYDHTIHIIDTVEAFRDMIQGMLDIYLSTISYKMNEVMKVLTIIATLFIPLTFIVGVYGMNFNTGISPWNMPELNWRYGYLAVMALMLGIVIFMLFYFKRKKWL
jgi:magnesium transporter